MSFFAMYPPSSGAANLSIGPNGSPAPTSSTEVGGIGPDGNLHPLSTDNSGVLNVNVDSSVLPAGGATAANQTIEISSLSSIDTSLLSKLSGSLVPTAFDENVITYVGVTTQIDTVTYKLAGVTVRTLTMTYDGSNRLIDVVAT